MNEDLEELYNIKIKLDENFDDCRSVDVNYPNSNYNHKRRYSQGVKKKWHTNKQNKFFIEELEEPIEYRTKGIRDKVVLELSHSFEKIETALEDNSL